MIGIREQEDRKKGTEESANATPKRRGVYYRHFGISDPTRITSRTGNYAH
jgi:hypothetical protein